jgi:hypothetical protein
MYILDDKKNLDSFVIPVGTANKINIYSEFNVIPSNYTTPRLSILNDGTTYVAGGADFNFRRVNAAVSNYDLTLNDYAIEIISNSINSVTLPYAVNNGGRYYVVSRGATTNNNLILKPQVGDNIDMQQFIQLRRVGDHINVMSNDVNSWYIF